MRRNTAGAQRWHGAAPTTAMTHIAIQEALNGKVGQRPLCRAGLYNVRMNEASFNALSAWLTEAGLAGMSETDIVSGFCDRCVAAGIPLGRAQVFIDTLHPVHEGRLFRWGFGPDEAPLLEYGRTDLEVLEALGSDPAAIQNAERWRHSGFFRMLQTGETFLRRRLDRESVAEFTLLPEWLAAGMT